MKNSLIFASFFLLLIGAIGVNQQENKRQKYLDGKIVTVKVIDKPPNCILLNSKTSSIKVIYKDRIFVKGIGYGYCDSLKKTKLKMKISINEDVIFFIDELEEINSQKSASYFILLIGVVISIISVLKYRK